MTGLDSDLRNRWTPSVEQDEAAFTALQAGAVDVLTAHLLVNKQQGWWGADVQVVPLPGIFADRNEASEAAEAAAKGKHEETGLPVTGGYTYHHLPDPRGPAPQAAGRTWKTSWSVFEDILVTFPNDKEE